MKKYFLIIIAAFSIAALLPATGCAEYAAEKNANIVTNGSFEEGTKGWSIVKNSAQAVEDVSHEGAHSLYYHNKDRNVYRLFTQNLDVSPGQILKFSAWVKGKDLRGQGAGIFMQSRDADKIHIPGSVNGGFPIVKYGTYDWTQIKGEYHVPDNAANTVIGLYLRKNSSGEAWFDDVEVYVDNTAKYTSSLFYPNYRGIILKGDTSPWKLNVRPFASVGVNIDEFQTSTSLFDSSGKKLYTQHDVFHPSPVRDTHVFKFTFYSSSSVLSTAFKEHTYTFKAPKDLPVGDYTLEQTILNSSGLVSQVYKYSIHVVTEMPNIYVDRQGFSIVNGKRFFPLGIYTGPYGTPPGGTDQFKNNARDADLKRMADAGLNTVLSYGYASGPISTADAQEYLDLAEKNGLEVVYSLKDMYDGHGYPKQGLTGNEAAEAQIRAVKDKPALLAWYINDEMSADWIDKINYRYHQILQMDPDHPAYLVTNLPVPYQTGMFVHSADILGTDPYPIGPDLSKSLPPDYVKDWITGVMDSGKGGWQVIQIHNSSYGKLSDALVPSLDAMRNMSYQSLINGATGITYFAYHWLFRDVDSNGKYVYSQKAFDKRWPDVQKLIQEIKPLTGVILQDNKVALKVLSPSTVQYQAWKDNGKLYVMVANAKTWDKSDLLQLEVPKGYHLAGDVPQGIKANYQEQKLQLELSPIASGTIILEK